MKKTIHSIIGMLLSLAALAQPNQVESLTIEHGLSQGMIFDILQTKDGFLWIATKDGLNRYDGYNFKVFSNDAFNPFSLAENTVRSLFEDSRGWLWIGTESKGLDVYDFRTNRFHHFPMDLKENVPGLGADITNILEDSNGDIWTLKLGVGLVRITIPAAWKQGLPNEPELERLTQITPIESDPKKIAELDWSRDFFILHNNTILLNFKQGLFLLNPEDGTYKPLNLKQLPGDMDKLLLADRSSANNLWLANLKQLYRLRNGEATVFTIPAELNPHWTMFYYGENDHIWFAVNNQLWDLAPGEDIDFSKPDLVLDKKPSCGTTDRNGNIWVGTIGYGLRKFNPTKKLFHAGAAGVSITGIWRSPKGKYYCKAWTRYTSIFPYDPKTTLLGAGSAFPDAPIQQFSLAFEPDGASWLLCTSPSLDLQGMLRHQSADGSQVETYDLGKKIGLNDKMYYGSDGLIWVFGTECQLVRFNPNTTRFDNLSFSSVFGKKANSVRTTVLTNGKDGLLWIGTQLGLVKAVKKGESFDYELIQATVDGQSGLNNNSISCLLPDPRNPNLLWIGTKGGGINLLDQSTGKFQHITTQNGLPNNVVYGILSASDRELWCSTNRGLAKITLHNTENQPLSFTITAFTASMGLQDNEFNTAAYFKADNGELLFGGVNGLNHFFPEALRLDTMPPPVFITGIEINHQAADFGQPGGPLTQPLEFSQVLHLGYAQNNVSFEFAALDFTDPSKNRYRYRLVGLDEDWVEIGTHRFAHFSHLSPGKYELLVQGSNGESAWRDAANPITVIINPPWWSSKLAYLCYFLLLVWIGWRAYKLQIQRVKEREQLAFEQRETERVKVLEQIKTNFFSNITHEFRTPLTLIIEPLRQLLKNPDDVDRQEKIRLAEKNSQRLMGLVNQLLDMAKIESGSMALDLRLGDFEQTVRGVFEAFLPLAAQRNIQLTLQVLDILPALEFDRDKIELVLNNLLSNALKFTPAGGQVKVSIGLRTYPDGLYTEAFVAVKDTGIGIPAEVLDKVFDRFYQVDSSHTSAGEGTGIGLALSKELAKLMRGGITVESKVGEGSTFSFWFPLLQKSASGHIGYSLVKDEPKIAFERSAPSHHLVNGEKPVVLVVEDNVELRNFISQSIGTAWRVVEATNGEEGVKKAIELLPDLVVSDLMMPLKDGYALCDELKTNELTAHIPVILLTAKSAIEAKLKGLRTGADDYLTKPFNTEELLARMENLVEMRRKLREYYGNQPVVQAASQSDNLSVHDREFLQKFTFLLEQHLADENLGVEDFAKKMFVSRVQLHRKLKAITDRSATDFIRDFRLERAHAMLKNREGLVSEIAMNVGFGNEKYFSTVFKEKFGVPPSQVQ